MSIHAEQIRNLVLALPELHTWPQVESLFTFSNDQVPLAWELPAIGWNAVGGQTDAVLPAVAAMGCLQRSITVVDDILDAEPDGIYVEMGAGAAANLAAALQAAASILLAQCNVPADQYMLAHMALHRLVLQTAVGQALDVQNLPGEENFWRIVRAKSVPFYAEGLRLGALLGGADPNVAQNLYEIGAQFGEIIQIHDDVADAFTLPAAPDWMEQGNNLLILYGVTADYPERERFVALCEQVADPHALAEAQQILVGCGAVSYGIYQAIQREQHAGRLLDQTALANPGRIADLFIAQRTPFVEFLQTTGMAIPEAISSMLLS